MSMTGEECIGYRVASSRTGEAARFAGGDWLESRERAVEFAGKLKAAADGDYGGIVLSLEYPATEGDRVELATHPILNGERMSSAEILKALHGEWEILDRLGFEFAEMRCEFENSSYVAVNHRYVTLYYFTALR